MVHANTPTKLQILDSLKNLILVLNIQELEELLFFWHRNNYLQSTMAIRLKYIRLELYFIIYFVKNYLLAWAK